MAGLGLCGPRPDLDSSGRGRRDGAEVSGVPHMCSSHMAKSRLPPRGRYWFQDVAPGMNVRWTDMLSSFHIARSAMGRMVEHVRARVTAAARSRWSTIIPRRSGHRLTRGDGVRARLRRRVAPRDIPLDRIVVSATLPCVGRFCDRSNKRLRAADTKNEWPWTSLSRVRPVSHLDAPLLADSTSGELASVLRCGTKDRRNGRAEQRLSSDKIGVSMIATTSRWIVVYAGPPWLRRQCALALHGRKLGCSDECEESPTRSRSRGAM